MLLVLAALSLAAAPSRTQQKQIIARIKRLSAHALDPTQPDTPLAEWLKQTLGEGSYEWQVRDCDLKNDSESDLDEPMCVTVFLMPSPGEFGLRLHIQVGTFGRGVFGSPVVTHQSFLWRICSACEQHLVMQECRSTFGSLAEVPQQVREFRAKPECTVAEPEEAVARRYAERLAAIRRRSPGSRLEDLLIEARTLNRLLLGQRGETSVLESMTDEQFTRLNEQLPGLILSRVDVVLVEPDSRFFLALAKELGTPVDIAFFEELDRTYRGDIWPSYMQEATPVSACTDYGSGELVARYRAWTAFRERFPNAYFEAESQMRKIEQAIGWGTCACGDRASVAGELAAFAEAFPKNFLGWRIRERVAELEKGNSDFTFQCSPQ